MLDSDFRRAWDAMATDSEEALRDADRDAGGNFMFARHAMGLLELACRVAAQSFPSVLQHFSDRLNEEQPCYFTTLPSDVPLPQDFTLPHVPSTPPSRQLLAALFDCVRHGQAHQYQQIPVTLADGQVFAISLTGVEIGRPLRAVRDDRSRRELRGHLSFIVRSSAVQLIVRPELLYLDFYDAARRAGVFSSGVDLEYLERPRRAGTYGFDAKDLVGALQAWRAQATLTAPRLLMQRRVSCAARACSGLHHLVSPPSARTFSPAGLA